MPKARSELTTKEKLFCENYILDWNGTKAAKIAGYSEKSAKEIASENLTKPHIKAYIKKIQLNLEKVAGISRLKVMNEFAKIAFSSIADLHNTWISLKEFENLTPDQKACIQEIQFTTETRKRVKHTQVKIKLYSKVDALKSIMDMLGYKAPEELNVSQVSAIRFTPVKESSNGVGDKVQ